MPGWDATFRAPKSASLLWALSDTDISRQVRLAHDQAVSEALGYLERNAARVRRGGHQLPISGFVAAAFRHRTSRAGDPLLHTHVLLANLGAAGGDQGRWRALDGRTLYSHARTAGFVYQAVLRHELTAALGIDWKPVVNGYADIAGVPRPLIDAFSTRRTEITRLLGLLGASSAHAAQMATLATRRAKTRTPVYAVLPTALSRDYDVDPASLRDRWASQAARLGWTPKSFNALLQNTHPAVLDGTAATGLATELLGTDGLPAGASTFSRRDVVRGWAQRLCHGATAAELEALADALLDERLGTVQLTPTIDTAAVDQVLAATCNTLGIDASAAAHVRASVALTHAIGAVLLQGTDSEALVSALTDREVASAADIVGVLVWRARRRTTTAPSVSRDGVLRRAGGAAVAAAPGEHRYTTPDLLAVEQRILDLAAAGRAAGRAVADPAAINAALAMHPTLSDEQRRMVRHLTSSGAAIDVVVGKAGTGKTYALAAARHAWQTSGTHVIGAALAARAAQELADGAGMPAFTVAKLLMNGPESGLAPGSVLIVDAAAMVGTRQLAQLRDLARMAHAKGRPRRRPPPAARDRQRRRLPRTALTAARRRAHRQPAAAQAWEREALDQLRNGSVPDALGAFHRAGRVTICDTADATREQLVTDWWAAAQPGQPDPTAHGVMLAYRRDEVDDLNARARAQLHAAGRLGESLTVRPGLEFAVGGAVVCTTNAPALRVINGARGLVTAVDPAVGSVVVQLPGGTVRPLPRSYLQEGGLAHGYAGTGHAAQGTTADTSWVLGSDLLHREWAYTVFSRHRHRVQLYLTGTNELPDWIEHPEALQADDRSTLERLTNAATLSRAQHLAIDQNVNL